MFRTITIDPVLNGFSVMIRFPEGEQELVFNTLDSLLQELRDYYTDPQGAEEHYRGTTNAQHIMGRGVTPEQPNEYLYSGGGGTVTSSGYGYAAMPATQRLVPTASTPSAWGSPTIASDRDVEVPITFTR